MLKNFLRHFKTAHKVQYTNTNNFYQDYFDQLGGMQFGGCQFNAFRLQDIPKWKEYIADAFPMLAGKVLPFGYSWEGTCFCVDIRDGKVIICDVGGGECYAIPQSMQNFLNEDLIKHGRELLELPDYKKWVAKNGMLQYGNCAGLKVPVFLGGSEENGNREVTDMEVYWGVLGQVKKQIMGK